MSRFLNVVYHIFTLPAILLMILLESYIEGIGIVHDEMLSIEWKRKPKMRAAPKPEGKE